MRKVKFYGHVDPCGTTISIKLQPVRFGETDFGESITIYPNISNSQIEMECILDRESNTGLINLWFYATGLAQAALNLAAFQLGVGISIILDRHSIDDGPIAPLSIYDPSLAPLCTAFTKDRGYDVAVNLVLKEPKLGVALNDLISSATHPGLVVMNCARTIDAIRKMIGGPTGPWPKMHAALNVDAAYLKLITDHSVEPRHGNPVNTPVAIKQEISCRAWTVMDRFLHYRLRGSIQLPVSEFPLLKG